MLVLYLIFSIIILAFSTLMYKLWWSPLHTQNKLHSQGLKGPSYKFLYGTTKEMLEMTKEALKTPYESTQHDIFPRLMPHWNTWMKLYGDNFVLWMGPQPQVIVTEPDLVKDILGNKGGDFLKLKPPGNFKKLIGDGLPVAEGEKWSRLRKLSNHAFHGDSLKDMVPAVIASVDSMLEKWRNLESKEIDICTEFKHLTSEVISRTAFGNSYLEGKNIFEMLSNLSNLVTENAFKLNFFSWIWKSKDDVEAGKMEQSLRDSIISLVKKREETVKAGEAEGYGNDILGMLLKDHHDSDRKSRISIDNIVDECKVFHLAGHESTSSSMSWTVFLMSKYPDWQEKAREEVLQLFGKEKPTAEGIGRLKILSMIFNEALRLYSPVITIGRRVDKKTKLGKYELPANVQIVVSPIVLHRNPEIWGKDAHLFKPERFAQGLAKASNGNSHAFLPFGFGPRLCVGLNFAYNEAKIALAMILQRYKLTLSPNYVHAPYVYFLVTNNAQYGIPIVLHPL